MTKIYVDGGCCPNGKGLNPAICVIKGKKKIVRVLDYKMKSGEVEYAAILTGIGLAKEGDTIISDCKGAVNRTSKYDLKAGIVWIPREQNLAGIYLEKRLKKLHRYENNITKPKKIHTLKLKHKKKK